MSHGVSCSAHGEGPLPRYRVRLDSKSLKMGYSDGGRQVSPQKPCGASTEKNLTAGALHVLQHGADTSSRGGGGGGGGARASPHVKVPHGRGLPIGPTHSDKGKMNESVIFVQELSPEAKKVRCRWVALQVSLTSSVPHWGSSGKRRGGEKHCMSGRRKVLQSELHRTLHTVMVSVGPAVALLFSTLLIIIKASGAISQAPIPAALAVWLGREVSGVSPGRQEKFRSKSGSIRIVNQTIFLSCLKR